MTNLLAHQRPPDGDWKIWSIPDLGRGSGKTFAAANYVIERLRNGQNENIIALAHDIKHAYNICMNEILRIADTGEFTVHSLNGSLIHPNGLIRLIGENRTDHIRGFKVSVLWIDEIGMCDYARIHNAIEYVYSQSGSKIVIS